MSAANGRKSIYHENRDKLTAALDMEDGSFNDESFTRPACRGGGTSSAAQVMDDTATATVPPPNAVQGEKQQHKILSWLEC